MKKSKLFLTLVIIAQIIITAVGCSHSVPLSIATTSLEKGSVGVAYSQTLQVDGGKAPYSWKISSGVLPGGLQLKAGEISGIPAAPGSFGFSVTVTDTAGATSTVNLSITIQRGELPISTTTLSAAIQRGELAISTTTLPEGKVGVFYSQTLTAIGGVPPYRWSIAFGILPAGLTQREGVISGTPALEGVFNFTMLLEDTGGSSTMKVLTIDIRPTP